MSEWPKFELDAGAGGELGITVGALPLVTALRQIQMQLEYLRARDESMRAQLKARDEELLEFMRTLQGASPTASQGSPTPSSRRSSGRRESDRAKVVMAAPVTDQADSSIQMLQKNLLEMSSNLRDKDMYFMHEVDSLKTRLYLIEVNVENTERHSLVSTAILDLKGQVLQQNELIAERFEGTHDVLAGLRLDMEKLERDVHNGRDGSQYAQREDVRHEMTSLREEMAAIDAKQRQLIDELQVMRAAPDLSEAVNEQRRRQNQLQEQENGSVVRINRAGKELTQLAEALAALKIDLQGVVSGDIARLSALIDKVSEEKANAAALHLKADRASVEVKADDSLVRALRFDLDNVSSGLWNSANAFEEKMTKKFNKLADFTTRSMRGGDGRCAANDEEYQAGAGKLKCLVCDHPIKTLDGETQYHPAKFYNTVGMLRYRKAHDDRAGREELARAVHSPEPKEHTVELSSPETRAGEATPSPRTTHTKHMRLSKVDAVFEYESRKRPQSAPFGKPKFENRIYK